jgi:magnesium chelatase family protein
VLFLDELPEFKRDVLEVMRQPLEDGKLTISRAAALTCPWPRTRSVLSDTRNTECGQYGHEPDEPLRLGPPHSQQRPPPTPSYL